MDELARLVRRCEELVDSSGVLPIIERRMPRGGRPRQISVRTLLIGMLLVPRRRRALLLTEIHETLTSLSLKDRRRLGVEAPRRSAWHMITYRQVEYTFGLVAATMDPSPVPSFRGVADGDRQSHYDAAQPADAEANERENLLNAVSALLLEATIPEDLEQFTGLAVDWTDADSWSKGTTQKGRLPADPNASWGRRRSQQPGLKDAMYFGYGETVIVMVPDVSGPPVPNLIRRMDLEAARADHAWHAVKILRQMRGDGFPPGELLGDSATRIV